MSERHPIGSFVRRFLLEDVAADRNLATNTQRSYRDTIRLLLVFSAAHYRIDATRLSVEHIGEELVRAFLAHLQTQRKNSLATCNQRLAAIHSFFRFIGRQVPELMELAAQMQTIPIRRTSTPVMAYLEKHEIDALLAIADQQTPRGRRDYALLLFLYNTGARASEAASLTIKDLTLVTPASVQLLGKGHKGRVCPLWTHTGDVLCRLLGKRVDGPNDAHVFLNVRGQPITRYGIHKLVERSVEKAAIGTPSLRTKTISPHTIRHTTAVHLLRAGVDINTIRAWLGHASLETTNRYAQVDLEMKAEALEQCAVHHQEACEERRPAWRNDADLMSFLASL